jgi:hypothetical protein
MSYHGPTDRVLGSWSRRTDQSVHTVQDHNSAFIAIRQEQVSATFIPIARRRSHVRLFCLRTDAPVTLPSAAIHAIHNQVETQHSRVRLEGVWSTGVSGPAVGLSAELWSSRSVVDEVDPAPFHNHMIASVKLIFLTRITSATALPPAPQPMQDQRASPIATHRLGL